MASEFATGKVFTSSASLEATSTIDWQQPSNNPAIMRVSFGKAQGMEIKLLPTEQVVFGYDMHQAKHHPDINLARYTKDMWGISGLHAKLRRELSGWWLEDLLSEGGTAVNGQNLAPFVPVQLSESAAVRMGNCHMQLTLPALKSLPSGLKNVDSPPMHVVNVEDNRDMQRMLQIVLRKKDPTINLQQFAVTDTALPYIIAHRNSIDLFVIDCLLPGRRNGVELAKLIRSIGCPGHIMLTSAFKGPPADTLRSLNAEFCPKTTHMVEIVQHLEKYRLQQGTIIRDAVIVPAAETAKTNSPTLTINKFEETTDPTKPMIAPMNIGGTDEPSATAPVFTTKPLASYLQRLIDRIRGI